MGRKDATLDEVLDMIDIVTARSGRQAFARDQLHLLRKNDPARRASYRRSPRRIRPSADWGDTNALKLFVDDGRGEDVVFVEQILTNGLRVCSFDMNVPIARRTLRFVLNSTALSGRV